MGIAGCSALHGVKIDSKIPYLQNLPVMDGEEGSQCCWC